MQNNYVPTSEVFKSSNKKTEIEIRQQQYQSKIDVVDSNNNPSNQYQEMRIINQEQNQQQQYQDIPNFSKETKSNYNQYLNASSIKNSNFRIPKKLEIDISEMQFESKLGEGGNPKKQKSCM